MTTSELATFLIEDAPGVDKKINTYINRLMLRFHSQPAILSNLVDVTHFRPGEENETPDEVEDGEYKQEKEGHSDQNETVVLQLAFNRLPQEIISPLIRLIAAPRDPKIMRYVKDGAARTGFEIELKPNDFPGDDYDYSQ
jgi:hypothetical protein